jgi:hypothetical protein
VMRMSVPGALVWDDFKITVETPILAASSVPPR